MTSSTQYTAVELPPQLLEHQKTLDEVVTKAKRTRAAVDDTAAQIPALEAEIAELKAKLAEKDADRAIAEDSEVKALDAELKKLAIDQDTRERALARARAAVKVLEARAPEQEEAVQSAVIVLENDLIALGGTLMERLRAEIMEKVKPLVGVFAAFKALGPLGGMAVREVIDAAYIPDPKGFMRMQGPGTGWMNYGTNLLDQEPDADHGHLAVAIAEALRPIRASLVAAKALGAYVPLDKRPKPYVRRGYTHEGVTGERRAAETQVRSSAPPEIRGPNDRQPPGFKARVRTGRVGDLPPGTPVDGEIGHQLVNNMMRGDSFAV